MKKFESLDSFVVKEIQSASERRKDVKSESKTIRKTIRFKLENTD